MCRLRAESPTTVKRHRRAPPAPARDRRRRGSPSARSGCGRRRRERSAGGSPPPARRAARASGPAPAPARSSRRSRERSEWSSHRCRSRALPGACGSARTFPEDPGADRPPPRRGRSRRRSRRRPPAAGRSSRSAYGRSRRDGRSGPGRRRRRRRRPRTPSRRCRLQLDPVGQAELVRIALAVRAEDAAAVRVVEHEQGAVALLELDQPGQWGRVAVHREDRVGDDQLAFRARFLEQQARWSRSRWR